MKNKGFTLIELLVVIAIIGILSSVVLASLNTARGKGADAAVKANLANMRAQGEIFYDNNSSKYISVATYTAAATTATCYAPTTVFDLTLSNNVGLAIAVATSTGGTAATCAIGTNGASWAASVPLKTNSATSWCVDSSGASKLGTATNTAGTVSCM